jgi:putative transposase
VQYLKGRSSRLIQDEFPELKKRYWGQHLWARGYFCATVGTVTQDMIREYIEHQFEHGDKKNFKIEDEASHSPLTLCPTQEGFRRLDPVAMALPQAGLLSLIISAKAVFSSGSAAR